MSHGKAFISDVQISRRRTGLQRVSQRLASGANSAKKLRPAFISDLKYEIFLMLNDFPENPLRHKCIPQQYLLRHVVAPMPAEENAVVRIRSGLTYAQIFDTNAADITDLPTNSLK